MNHTPRFVARTLCSLVLTLGAGTLAAPDRAFAQKPAADATEKPIKPEEPVRAILAAFESHHIVALDEGRHGNEQPFGALPHVEADLAHEQCTASAHDRNWSSPRRRKR